MGRHAGPHLTQEAVNTLPQGRTAFDGKVPGLSVRASGRRKVFRFKAPVKSAGLTTVIKGKAQVKQYVVKTLGYADEIDLSEARRRALMEQGEILKDLGNVEGLRRKAQLGSITLEWAWDRYVQECRVPHGRDQKPCTPRTIEHYEATLRLYFDTWRTRRILDIAKDRDGFKAHYRALEQRGKYVARTADKHFRIIWADLVRSFPELKEYGCPADVLGKRDKVKTENRQIAYQPEELPGVMPSIWKAGRFRAGLQYFLMLSGCRATGVKTALRSDYDREAGTLLLRHHKGKEHTVYLSPVMISLLDAMVALGERYFPDKPYIFCAFSKEGHVTSAAIEAPPSAALLAHRAKTGRGGDDEIGTHIWRNTWVSLAPAAGLSGRDARQLIGHSTGDEDSHEGYATPIPSHLRAQQERMSDYLMTQAGKGAAYRFSQEEFLGVRELEAITGLI